VHDLLVADDGGLSAVGEAVAPLREQIRGMRNSAAFFTIGDVDGIDWGRNITPAAELAGSWPLEDFHGLTGRRRQKYVNPDHAYAARYSDIVVECGCGEFVHRERGDSRFTGGSEEKHADDCRVYQRTLTRGRVSEARYEELARLYAIGWRTPRAAPRLGMTRSALESFVDRQEVDLGSLRETYRREAAETYVELVDGGAAATDVAEAYGHPYGTLSNWASEYVK